MLSAGIEALFARAIARRRRGLAPGSPPPMRAATVISFVSLVKSFPRFASAAPFLCLMVLHLLWPDIVRSEGLRIARTPGPANGGEWTTHNVEDPCFSVGLGRLPWPRGCDKTK